MLEKPDQAPGAARHSVVVALRYSTPLLLR
jgi:hypothetical protein